MKKLKWERIRLEPLAYVASLAPDMTLEVHYHDGGWDCALVLHSLSGKPRIMKLQRYNKEDLAGAQETTSMMAHSFFSHLARFLF